MPPTLLELCKHLNREGVRYLLIGGQASLLYGVPRQTLDVDIFIAATSANCRRLLEALQEAGIQSAGQLTPEIMLKKDIFSIMEGIRIDIFTEVLGLPSFERCFGRRKMIDVGPLKLPCLHIDDLIKSKSSDRPIDQQDVDALRRLKR